MKTLGATMMAESVEATLKLGRVIGECVAANDVIGLCGPLGAGKTQLAKGLAAGLGVDEQTPVTSPTFVLVREYAGRLRLYHCDVYRLGNAQELLDLGFEEMINESDAVTVVEWADRVSACMPARTWWVEAEHAGPEARRFSLRLPDAPATRALLGLLSEYHKPPA